MNVGLGDTVGAYRVVGELGMGGSGKVVRARHTITGRIEALKVLADSGEPGSKRAQQFMREIRLQANIEHPNVAVVHNAFWLDKTLVMVMEFVDGTSLRELLRGGPLTISSVFGYARQALSALSYTHSLGITHRDISPSNILITPSGTVKITDFGLAAALGTGRPHKQEDRTLMGSVYYMSPEQVKSATDLDARTDVYSLGAVLYEALTGTRPFSGDSAYAVMEAHVNQVPDPPSKRNPRLSPQIDRFILKALEKDRKARYESMAEFAEALDSLSVAASAVSSDEPSGQPVAVRGQGRKAAASPIWADPAVRLRLLQAAGGFAAVLLISLGIWAWTGRTNAPPQDEPAAVAQSRDIPPAETAVTGADPDPESAPLESSPPESGPLESGPVIGAASGAAPPKKSTTTRSTPAPGKAAERQPAQPPPVASQSVQIARNESPPKPSPVPSDLADDRRNVIAEPAPTAPPEQASELSRGDQFAAAALEAGGPVLAVALSPDGRWVAAALQDNSIVIWDTSGREKASLKGHTGRVTALAFSADGRSLASGSVDGTAKVWDVVRQRESRTLGHKASVTSVTFSPDGQRLATGSDDKAVSLWDLTPGGAFREYRGHKEPAQAVAFSPNGKQIVSAARDVRLWGTETTTRPALLDGLPGDAEAIAFSPDGRTIAAAGTQEVGVWDIEQGRRRQVVRIPGYRHALSFDAQGHCLAVTASGSPSGEVHIWDLVDPRPIITFQGEGMLRSVALTPAARVVAAAGDDGRILLWRKNLPNQAAVPAPGRLATATEP